MSGVWRLGVATSAPVVLLAIGLGGCSFDLGSWSLGARESEAAPKNRPPSASSAAMRRPRHPRPGAGKVRKNARGAGRIRQGARLDPYNMPSAVQPRPALSARKAASAGGRGFQRRQRPDAAAGRTAAGSRDQLPRDGQDQGSRRRSRRGGAGRPAKRTGMDDPRDRPMSASATRTRPRLPMAAPSPSAPGTKPREAAWRASAASLTMTAATNRLELFRDYRGERPISPPTARLRR